jgi:hypothetical protein
MTNDPIPFQRLAADKTRFSTRKILGDRIAWHIHTFVLVRPKLFYTLLTLLRRNTGGAIHQNTGLVIAGIGGCSNTYALKSVQSCHPDLHIASHQHAPLQVIRASQVNAPCLVLIRHPIDSISSCTSRGFNKLSEEGLRWELKNYVFFYNSVIDLRDTYVAASFHNVITDYSAVITKVNEHYGTALTVPEQNSDEVKSLVDKHKWRDVNRRHAIEGIHEFLHRPSLAIYLAAAEDAYQRFCTATGLSTEKDPVRTAMQQHTDIPATS